MKIKGTLATVALCATLAAPAVAAPAADLVLRAGRFYPVSRPGPVEGSMAIRAGRISFLGPDEEIAAWIGAGTRTVDLGGRTVTPGWIDAHSHLLGLGSSLSSLGGALARLDLVGTVSYEEVVERVRRAAAELPAGSWVQGRGWDQNDWPVARFPDHRALSEAVPDHPVWLTRIDGHAALLNARALEVLSIPHEVADPPGGRFVRDAEGRLTGVLIDAAMGAVEDRRPEPTQADLEVQLLAAARHCLERGLTTVTEMGVGESGYRAYAALRARGELPLRAALYLSDDPAWLEQWFGRGPELDPAHRLTVRGVKLYMDGALGSRGAALVEPYDDDPDNVGLLQTTSDHVERVCRRALASGFHVGTHAIGDRGALLVLDAYERCLGGHRAEARLRVEHAQVMRPADLERMARLGVIASMQPTHATSDMPWAEERVGPRRIRGAYAWRTVLEHGGTLALGSDFPVEEADPRLGLYAAVTRSDRTGRPPGGWLPEQRLSRDEALAGFTLEAARSLFLDHEIGSLEVGKRADLTVFAADIMTVPDAEIPDVAIDLTLVDGEIVYQREGAD